MWDDLAKNVASTTNAVFGNVYQYTKPGYFTKDIQAVLRKDIETLDEHDQVVGRTNTLRIAHSDIDFTPERGDFIVDECDTYKLGKRHADDGNAYLFEVQK